MGLLPSAQRVRARQEMVIRISHAARLWIFRFGRVDVR
jgi:hypothetical protein